MYEGGITDIFGITAGHAQDDAARTGCTAVLCPKGAVGGVDVRGGSPGTRETDLLRSENMVSHVHGIMLCGGSAFGLAAADGAMRYLEELGAGFDTGVARVPIVPAAVLFDLGNGRGDIRPDAAMGYAACLNASPEPLTQGRVGAGCGATVGKVLGPQGAMPGGLGTASITVGEATIAAIVAVNAVGDVVDYQSGRILAGARLPDGEFADVQRNLAALGSNHARHGANTTIGIVATDAALLKPQVNRLCMSAHDGYAMAIRPAHMPMDGDTVFGMSHGDKACDFALLCAAAGVVMARAIANAVST